MPAKRLLLVLGAVCAVTAISVPTVADTGSDVQARADLLEIIEDRAASKPHIIPSQLPIEHWHAWIGDATIADAILDRLMQQNHRLTLTGESLRQRQKTTPKEPKPDPIVTATSTI